MPLGPFPDLLLFSFSFRVDLGQLLFTDTYRDLLDDLLVDDLLDLFIFFLLACGARDA